MSHIIVFYTAAFIAIASALVVAFSRNIVHSAFALLGSFAGVAVLFALAGADLVAMIQFVIYIGGILILFLFAVMLTSSMGSSNKTSPSKGVVFALITAGGVLGSIIWLIFKEFRGISVLEPVDTAARIGDMLLSDYVLPFEVISVLLLLALIGAVILARREVREKI